jgi:hypothetical protein
MTAEVEVTIKLKATGSSTEDRLRQIITARLKHLIDDAWLYSDGRLAAHDLKIDIKETAK